MKRVFRLPSMVDGTHSRRWLALPAFTHLQQFVEDQLAGWLEEAELWSRQRRVGLLFRGRMHLVKYGRTPYKVSAREA